MGKRVVLAMSGGVDSSVAAALLKEQGYDVVGIFMRTGASIEDAERRSKTCCSVADALDAQRVADRLDIPFYALDFERDFGADQRLLRRRVPGRPHAQPLRGLQHLAQVRQALGLWQSRSGPISWRPDITPGSCAPPMERCAWRAAPIGPRTSRTSSSGLRPELLPHVLFPVGGFAKSEIRAIAREHGLPVHDKPDSQEICFVPDDDYLGFVRDRRPERQTAGTIVDEDGTVLGEHAGIEAFTIGQRRGLGIARRRAAVRRPDRALEPDGHRRQAGVARESSACSPRDSTGRGPCPSGPTACLAQIRAQHRAVPATVMSLPDDRARVLFAEPPVRRSRRARSSPSTKTTSSWAAAGSTDHWTIPTRTMDDISDAGSGRRNMLGGRLAAPPTLNYDGIDFKAHSACGRAEEQKRPVSIWRVSPSCCEGSIEVWSIGLPEETDLV